MHIDVQRQREIDIKEAQKQYEDARNSVINISAVGTLAGQIKSTIDNEIQEAETLLKKTIETRNILYGFGVIFSKYHNPVALSSFYEYLLSGRTETLEGANGAYNIYESEIRANRIISQLDDVLHSLEEIKNNQYLIYQSLGAINFELSSLNQSMNAALHTLDTISLIFLRFFD